MWEKIKEFFKDLWQSMLPLLKTAFTFGLNWLYNWIKNKVGYKQYVKELKTTQTQKEPTDFYQWKRIYGSLNCIEKKNLYFDKKKKRI